MNIKLFLIFAIVSLAFTVVHTDDDQGDDITVNSRFRRGVMGSGCQNLVVNNSYCIRDITWNLKTMFMNANCNGSNLNNTLRADCIQREVCQSSCPIESIDEKITCSKNQNAWRKFILLRLLCSQKEAGVPCIRILYEAYFPGQAGNFKLQYLNTTSKRCCIASLMKVYNSSGNVTEFLAESWTLAGLPVPKVCHLEGLETSTTISSSKSVPTKVTLQSTTPKAKHTTKLNTLPSTVHQTNKITTQAKDPIRKKASDTVSTRLKASLVIASIIFVVVAVIVGRFFYHRMQRKRRAKYEDYGYSQLKVILEDNLYEDEEDDDDPLLSAT